MCKSLYCSAAVLLSFILFLYFFLHEFISFITFTATKQHLSKKKKSIIWPNCGDVETWPVYLICIKCMCVGILGVYVCVFVCVLSLEAADQRDQVVNIYY